MSDSADRTATRMLMVVTGLMGLGFVGFLVSALNWQPSVALAMLGSATFGAIAASTFWVSRAGGRRQMSEATPTGVRALAEQIEYDRDVVSQLEERLEFAERLLAEQRNPQALGRPEVTPR